MKKFIITNIDKYSYFFVDEKNNNYKLNLEFLDLDTPIQVNDIIYLNSKIYNSPNTFYTFGPLYGKYGKKLDAPNYDDIIIIDNHQKRLYLQRYYG